jgi:prepilin-type N-terminal cleavage/methylation domain-containing protein
MQKNKGFTLIELLVVIAIIGILSAVVLASLNNARDKGSNAAIKANLNGIRSQSAIVYDENNQDYTTVCTDTKISEMITSAIEKAGVLSFDGQLVDAQTLTPLTANCHSDTTGWAVSVPLKVADGANVFWCVDNVGGGAARANILGASEIVCPTS